MGQPQRVCYVAGQVRHQMPPRGERVQVRIDHIAHHWSGEDCCVAVLGAIKI